ncbi:hypothetical protein [Agromyces laixinhei]|uniref:hypothetical protein n=1 Tax=Agromyces laixinhei TaxID=2585717 RepID=UPI0012EEDE0D|nr:hypothetical protein [Agromyces laixinhei]
MTTPDNTTQNTDDNSASPRPFGFWLTVIDRRLDDAMRELFAEEGINRRDWRRINLIAGTVTDPRMSKRLAARPERVEPLTERGWVEGEPGAWRLTDAGDAARAALQERVAELRAKVAGAVSPEDFATTMVSLEAIAGELGWVEGERVPRRHHRASGRRQHGGSHGQRQHGDKHGRGRSESNGERHSRCGHSAARTDVHLHVHVHGEADRHSHGRKGDRDGGRRHRGELDQRHHDAS